MREYRGADRGGKDYTREHSHGSSSAGGESIRPKAPEEEATERVARFCADVEQTSTLAKKLGTIAVRDEWRTEKEKIEQSHAKLERAFADREKDAAIAHSTRTSLDTAKTALSEIATTLQHAKEPRAKPPVAGELEIEAHIVEGGAIPDDVFAWAAGLSASQRTALASRLSQVSSSSDREDKFAVALANFLGTARLLHSFQKVLANPKRFDRAAYDLARAERAASAGTATQPDATAAPAPQPAATADAAVQHRRAAPELASERT